MLRSGIRLFVLATLFFFCATTANAADSDLDGVDDSSDNCTELANPDQLDSDADGYGNRCDGDYDNDGTVDSTDYDSLVALIGSASYDAVADHDGSGIVNVIDVTLFMQIHGKPPGPSGLACAGSPPCPAS